MYIHLVVCTSGGSVLFFGLQLAALGFIWRTLALPFGGEYARWHFVEVGRFYHGDHASLHRDHGDHASPRVDHGYLESLRREHGDHTSPRGDHGHHALLCGHFNSLRRDHVDHALLYDSLFQLWHHSAVGLLCVARPILGWCVISWAHSTHGCIW